jgi:hypothetical protein
MLTRLNLNPLNANGSQHKEPTNEKQVQIVLLFCDNSDWPRPCVAPPTHEKNKQVARALAHAIWATAGFSEFSENK